MDNANENDKKNVFQERFRELVGDTATQEEIAKKINTSRQNVGNWLNGKSKPDIYALAEIANGYNVSTDYLLGRTEIKSTDTTMQAVCNYTGLNEEVIQLLLENKNGDLPEYILPCLYANNIVMSLLNHLLSQRAFYMTIGDLVNTARHITLYKFLTSDKDKSNAIVNLNNRFSEIFINDFNIDYVIDYEKKTIYEKFQQLIDTMINSYDVEEDDFLKGQIEHFADENYMPF